MSSRQTARSVLAEKARARAHKSAPRPVRDSHPRAVTWEEPLGAGERMFLALRRFTPINVTRVVALEGSVVPETVRAALRKLHARHPLLRCQVVESGTGYFLHGAASGPRLTVVPRRDDAHWREELERVLDTHLTAAGGAPFEVRYLYCPRSRRAELILAGEHAICDGVSMNRLCAELVGLCAGAVPLQPRSRRPVLDALLPAYSPWQRARSFARSLLTFAGIALQRAVFETRPVPASSRHAFLELSVAETQQLVDDARAAGTTVTGALMAAVLLALREARPRPGRLAMSVPIDMRPRIPGHDLSAEDVGNYTTAAYLESSGRAERWELARMLKARLDQLASGDQLLAAVPLVYAVGRLLARRSRSTLAHMMLSNSGKVPMPEQHGELQVAGFYSATSAPMLAADFSFFCNTLGGRLCLNLVFAEELVSRAEAERVLARVHASLLST